MDSCARASTADRETPADGHAWRTLSPSCEALGNRQLLSTMAAPPAVLPVPAASAVATAAATLNELDPTAFAQFQTDLAKAESQSRVSLAQVKKLARYEKIIDQTIESYSPNANTMAIVLNTVQTDVDNAFLENGSPATSWAQQQQELSQLLDQSSYRACTSRLSSFVRQLIR